MLDKLTLVILVIGVILILTTAGMIYLVTQDKAIPGTLETILVSGMTGLLGILVTDRRVP